jgi:ubiquitin-conjugating enzyme E2 J1
MLCIRSRDWTCPHCQQTNLELLPDPPSREEEADQKKWGAGNILGSQIPHENGPQVTADDSSAPSTAEAEDVSSTTTEATFFETREQEPRQSSKKPHILLDSAICILLVLLFAIICRRIV